MTSLADLQAAYHQYCVERGWLRFHDAQSLTLALTAEVGEVAELLQWLSADDVRKLTESEDSSLRGDLRLEIADVLIYTISLANCLHIDLEDAFREKLTIIKRRAEKGVDPTSPL